jgi:hypothetical protein
MSADIQLASVDRYLDKNWLDIDFPLDKVWEALSQRDKLLEVVKMLREHHMIDDSHHADMCEYCIKTDALIKEIEVAK